MMLYLFSNNLYFLQFTLNRLLNDGSITEYEYNKLHEATHYYFKNALEYIPKKFPIDDELICNSVWIDVVRRDKAKWDNVHFFLEKFKTATIMEKIKYDDLYEEFIDFQSLTDEDIGQTAWSEAKVIDGEDSDGNEIVHHRVDILWYYISQMKLPETSLNH